MATKKSQEVFIQELEDKYPDQFTYDKTVYVNTHTKVIITCKIHGDFLGHPSNLLRGHSCPKCAIEKNRVAQTKTTEWFISKAKEIHGDTFLYDKTQYFGQKEKVTITCRVHGDIDVTPHQHIAGCGCIECAMDEIRTTFQKFVEKSNSVHANRYLYQDDGLFKGRRSKVNIICPEHGVFTQVAHNHLKGQGCPTCSRNKLTLLNTKDTEWFINKAKELHGEKYSYTKSQYTTCENEITITCPVHGDFNMLAKSHVAGQGCRLCKYDAMRVTFQEFVDRSNEIHNQYYKYFETDLANNILTVVDIECPIHGVFKQKVASHLQGRGCQCCASSGFNPSKPAHLYVLEIEGLPLTFTGYGITGNRNARLSDHKRNLKKCGFSIIKEHWFYCENGKLIADLERVLSKQFQTHPQTSSILGFKKESCKNTFSEVVTFVTEQFNKITGE